jgi:hypothetical protein
VFKGEGAMLNFIAYGEELNLVHPPRPADPKQRWDQEWAVKLRLKSTGTTMLAEGMGAPRAGGEADSPREAERAASAPTKPPGAADVLKEGVNVLRGIFGR